MSFTRTHQLVNQFQAIPACEAAELPLAGPSTREAILSELKLIMETHHAVVADREIVVATGVDAAALEQETSRISDEADESLRQLSNGGGSPDFGPIKALAVAHFISGNWAHAVQQLTHYVAAVRFALQADPQAPQPYFEYYHLLYVIQIHRVVWAESDAKGRQLDMAPLELISHKADYYYAKNKTVLAGREYADELEYYRQIKLAQLFVFAKNMDIARFLEGFATHIEAASADPDLVNIYEVFLVLTQEFRQLSLVDDDHFETYALLPWYATVLEPLARARFPEVSQRLASAAMAPAFTALMARFLPGPPQQFYAYWSGVVTVKVFLLIMSMLRRVPRATLEQMMGTGSPSVAPMLVLACAMLLLGSLGYDVEGEFFYNYSADTPTESSDRADLQRVSRKVALVAGDMSSEWVATLIKAQLVSKTV